MKFDLGKRILLFVHWLLTLILLALVVVLAFTDGLPGAIGTAPTVIIAIALAAVSVVLSVFVARVLFKREPAAERGFITVDSSDTGKVRVSVGAVEQMVRQAVRPVDGIADMKIGVDSVDEAIDIQLAVTMVNGSHVPTVTGGMQRAIRKYVELNSGVAVHSVSVSIQAVTPDGTKRLKRSELKPALPEQPEATVEVYPVVVPETIEGFESFEVPAEEIQPEAAEEPVYEESFEEEIPEAEYVEEAAEEAVEEAEPVVAEDDTDAEYEPEFAEADEEYEGVYAEYSEEETDEKAAEEEPVEDLTEELPEEEPVIEAVEE